MKKQKKQKTLSAQYLIKINKVFEKNQWLIEDTEDATNSLFNRYCERILDIGENKKKDLMLELTERYLWVEEDEYLEYLIDALVKLIALKSNITEKTKIYVMPLISPDDEGKTKSSSMLVYLFNSVKLRHNSKLSKYKFEIVDKKSEIELYLKEQDAVLLLADDYIGTGETAEKCIMQMMKKGVEPHQLAILSLVAQESGINYLEQYGICITSSIIRKKGISDYYEGKMLEDNIKLMQEIETKMSIKEKYKFGYGGSESLVTMCRTPNNTFPLFWEESGNMKVAPFPRF